MSKPGVMTKVLFHCEAEVYDFIRLKILAFGSLNVLIMIKLFIGLRMK